MRSRLKFLVLLPVLCCAGCLRFDHGIVDTPLPNDTRLVGAWVSPLDKSTLRVTAISPVQMNIDDFDAHGCKKSGDSDIILTRTQIAGRDYLEFSLGKKNSAPTDRLFLFFAYRVDPDNHLIIFGPDLDLFQHAVEVGDIQGIVTYPKDSTGKRIFPREGPDIHITDSTWHLRAYLAAHPEAMKESRESPQPFKLDKVPNINCQK